MNTLNVSFHTKNPMSERKKGIVWAEKEVLHLATTTAFYLFIRLKRELKFNFVLQYSNVLIIHRNFVENTGNDTIFFCFFKIVYIDHLLLELIWIYFVFQWSGKLLEAAWKYNKTDIKVKSKEAGLEGNFCSSLEIANRIYCFWELNASTLCAYIEISCLNKKEKKKVQSNGFDIRNLEGKVYHIFKASKEIRVTSH